MKGLAVSQIILLVLGIIVLAVVAYLLYTQFVGTGSTISAEECRAAATRACTACSIANAGDISNCPAATYLSSANDKQCAGVISGTSKGPTDPNTGSFDVLGNIACGQYVGGTSPVQGGGNGEGSFAQTQ